MSVNRYVRAAVGLSARCIALSVSMFFGSILSLQIFRTLLRGPQRLFYVKARPNPPEITLERRYGSHHFAKIDRDITLHYVANGRKGAPLVLLVHGFPECWWSWRHQLTALSEKYYAVAFDMRGYCESSKPSDVNQYHVRDLVSDVHSLIKHLGYEKCILVGHDWGGVVSWHFTSRHAAMVEKLVVLSCPHPTVFRQGMSNWRQLLKWAHMFYLQLPWLPEFVFRCDDLQLFDEMYRGSVFGVQDPDLITDDDIEMFKFAFSQPNALTGAMNYYRAQFSTESLTNMLLPVREKPKQETPSRTKRIPTKTLILWGGRDPVLPVHLATASLKFCEDAKLQIFDQASHWLQQHEPIGVNLAIKQFLDEK